MLVLKDVHKTFNRGSANEKIALKGITLSVNEGDFITVIGGNGAGKSTMLNMISGAFPVDSGMIKNHSHRSGIHNNRRSTAGQKRFI